MEYHCDYAQAGFDNCLFTGCFLLPPAKGRLIILLPGAMPYTAGFGQRIRLVVLLRFRGF